MTIKVKSITEVAFLRVNGFAFQHLEQLPSTGPHLTFLFVLDSAGMAPAQVDSLRNDFRNGRALIEPRRFADLIKDTGDILFDEIRSKRGK